MEAILITFYVILAKQGLRCKATQESTKSIIHLVPKKHTIKSFAFIYFLKPAIFAYSERQVNKLAMFS